MPAKRPSVLQGYFGGTSLMPAMRRAFEFSELLTETSYLFVMKKKLLLFFFTINIKRKTLKSIILKIKSLNKPQLRKKKTFDTRGLNPGRLGTSPPLQRLSYADSRFKTLKPEISGMRGSILKRISYSEVIYGSLLNSNKKKFQNKKVKKITFFVSFR